MASRLQQLLQFSAVLRKNFILQTRSRRSILGISGWGALLVQILLPVAFFSLMCIPKYYIQPYQHPVFLQSQEYDIDTKWWAGASPYEGPAYSSGGNARVVFVPNTPEVQSLAQRVAMAVSCPNEAYKRICSSASVTTFACLFGVKQAPAGCEASEVCMQTPACYKPALSDHIRLMSSEAEVRQLLQQEPDSVDAVVIFPQAAAAADNSTAADSSARSSYSSSSSRAKMLYSDSDSDDSLLLGYVIRMNSSDVPPTQLLLDMWDVSPGIMPVPGNLLWEYRKYWFFMNLQLVIDRALLGGQQSNSSYPANLGIKIKPFPWPAKQEDLGAATAAAFFNLLLVYAFLAPTRAVVASIVREKELRLREGMKILGLSESAYWCSWSLTHWLTLAASGLLCALVGKYPFSHSSLLFMLCFYWLFSAALISFSYFLSTLFTASRVAGTATQLIYAMSMIPGFLLPFVRPYGGLSWYLASLSPTSAASLFAASLVNWERLAVGVRWNTLWLPVTQGSGYCVVSVMWLLMVDVLLYAGLTWYCDKVMPTAYGQTLPPWFIFMPSYWRSRSSTVKGQHTSSSKPTYKHRRKRSRAGWGSSAEDSDMTMPLTADMGDGAAGAGTAPNGDVHVAPPAGAPYIRVVGLRRVFRGSDGQTRVAVEGLNLEMSAGRITALLGHNGAGKTTTIHMLTGMLQPTSGTAYIGGADITTSMSVIRHSLGICPQFDILWPDITVLEHLAMYAVIKGASWNDAAKEARQAAAEVGLSDKLSSLASELSGGQRRKLSVAIAFLGSPAVVFLDEPTSGMDPYSRRATWEVIRSRRSSSVIVLTTHSMEEADLLCDDIVIMSEGRRVASGTPSTLKAQYGLGYTLTLVLQKPARLANPTHRHSRSYSSSSAGLIRDGGLGLGSGSTGIRQNGSASSLLAAAAARAGSPQGSAAAVDGLLQLIRDHVPSAVVLSAAGAEVSFRLPKEDSAAFPAVLRSLDAEAGVLGVASYGLSVTTLEEVFLAVADQAVSLRASPQNLRNSSPSSSLSISSGVKVLNDASNQHSSPAVGDIQAHVAAPASAPVASKGAARGSNVDGDGHCDDGDAGDATGGDDDALVHGAWLYWQQFQALFVKRMLCARRDRLAVITQLLVPMLLVLIAMAVSNLQTSHHQQPTLEMNRQRCLLGAPALLAAAPSVRQQVEFRGFMDGFPRSEIVDTQYTQLYHGSSGPPLNLTLEGQLLSQFYSGTPHYDSLYLKHMPPLEQLLTSLGDGPVMTLSVNQSAVSGLPAALNQATTALLRVMVAAGGGKSHPGLGLKSRRDAIPTWNSRSSSSSEVGVASDVAPASNSSTIGSNDLGPAQSQEGSVHANIQSAPAAGTTPAKRQLHSISIRNFSSVAAACDASSCMCKGGMHLPSCLPRISVSSSPLPLSPNEGAQRVREDAGALMLVLCMTMAASVLSASFVVFLVREQENNSKHLQLVSGAPPTAFWLANYCWDIINFSLPAAGIVLLVWGYHQPQLAGIRLAAMAVLLWVFGSAGIAVTYLCHFMFKDEMKALQRLNTAYFLIGYLGFTTTWVLSLIARLMRKQTLGAVTGRVKAVLRVVSPHYCFAQGLYDITNTYQGAGALPIPGLQPAGPHNPFTYSVLGTAVVHLLAQALLFGLATVLVDVGLLQLLRPTWYWCRSRLGMSEGQLYIAHHAGLSGSGTAPNGGGNGPDVFHQVNGVTGGTGVPDTASKLTACPVGMEAGLSVGGGLLADDDDVVAERCAVEAGQGLQDAMVVLDGISKVYHQGYALPPLPAVKGLWLRIMRGECFGLLGVNGAGKTTTFKVLTGEITPDTGDASIAGHSVLTQLLAARRSLGYCPQFEALPSAMTGREVLHMYARLRGVKGRARIHLMADQLLQQLGVQEYADVVCGAYSGGNKRKLNVAVALVGGPPLVLLDEPSTGLDPAARRFLWKVLQSDVLCAGRTIILTSHSMEEVDALASRLVIMAAGAATCLGTPQHLKTKYGDGYTLELRVAAAAATERVEPHPSSSSPEPGATAAGAGATADGVALVQQQRQQLQDSTQAAVAATAAAEHHFLSLMPGAIVLERERGRLLLRLPIGSSTATNVTRIDSNGERQQVSSAQTQQPSIACLADVFEAVESLRQELGITEYSLSQSSLERVFLALARAASQAADGE